MPSPTFSRIFHLFIICNPLSSPHAQWSLHCLVRPPPCRRLAWPGLGFTVSAVCHPTGGFAFNTDRRFCARQEGRLLFPTYFRRSFLTGSAVMPPPIPLPVRQQIW